MLCGVGSLQFRTLLCIHAITLYTGGFFESAIQVLPLVHGLRAKTRVSAPACSRLSTGQNLRCGSVHFHYGLHARSQSVGLLTPALHTQDFSYAWQLR
jgi:hypothetical protein